MLQFLSPSTQQIPGLPTGTVKTEKASPDSGLPTPSPPLLQESMIPEDFPPSVIEYLKGLWDLNSEVSVIDGVSIGRNELTRLLHVQGTAAYMNDSIVDALGGLLNSQDGDFWIFQSLLFQKLQTKEPVDRWVTRTMKRWVQKWGKGHIPRHIFFPFAIALHYRVIYWDTHRDRVVYIDPLEPHGQTMEEEWKDRAIQLCDHMGSKWNTQKVCPPEYGIDLPILPVQVDGTSCGVYIVVFMLMLINGWESVNFPLEATNHMRLVVSRCLGKKRFPMHQLANTLNANVPEV